ncbi:hypothetical protein IGK61_003567 [Enterococcus sp. AZ063]
MLGKIRDYRIQRKAPKRHRLFNQKRLKTYLMTINSDFMIRIHLVLQ